MSSMDQAFVKAFARRKRSSNPTTAPRQPAVPPAATPSDEESPTASVAIHGPADEPGSLKVDPSMARTAQVWVDPIEDQIARADAGSLEIPKPHVESQVQPGTQRTLPPSIENVETPEHRDLVVEETGPSKPEESSPVPTDGSTSDAIQESAESLQHIHTAYASALADIPVFPPATAFPVETTLPLEAPTTLPSDAAVADEVEPEVAKGLEVDTLVAAPTVDESTATRVIDDAEDSSADVLSAPAAEPSGSSDVQQYRIDAPIEQPVAPQPVVPFQAAWEVDVFDVPTVVADLFFEGALLQQVAEHMSEAVDSGLRSVLITSTKQGEGRSCVAIGMAMACAAAGIRVALVDADTDNPTLAEDLRLDLQHGWVDTIRGDLPIKEVAVHAVEDGVTLIPLMPPQGNKAATAFEVVQLIGLLKEKFELVIVDGPPGPSPAIHQCASAADSAIIVRDMSRTDTLAISEFSSRLQDSGVHGVGVVENFS